MAIVYFVPYQGGQIHAERTNEYIANGHGDEVLVRTNRYVTGDHTCGNRCVGVNCPSDPALASELMETLRVQYENNLGDRKTKGTTDDKEPVAHYQLIVSWHDDESVPVDERYEMARELIERTKLRNHANLLAAHDNEDHDHVHDSVSAFSLDGHSKLCMNKTLLYELRREMDRICVEHGYSIVEAPELWGDKDYKEWFDCVKDLEVVPVHPPLPRKKRTQKQQYADAKKDEREEDERRKAELNKPRKITPENRGTDFYSLPHVYSPSDPDEQLFIYALDDEGKRKSPLKLDYELQFVWATACSRKLEAMPDFRGKKALTLRMHWAEENAWEARCLMDRLDIGTREELAAHTQAVGGDISRFKQEIARQEKVVASATEEGDTAKLARAVARKERAEKTLAQRKAEYRELKHAAAVLESMDSGEQWAEFRTELLQRSTKRLKVYNNTEAMIRENYRDIGQLLGISQAEIDRIIADAKEATLDQLEHSWVVYSGTVRITYTRRKGGLSAIYDHIGDQYAERRAVRSKYYQLQRDFPVVGPITALLYLALAIPLAVAAENERSAYELRIANAKRVAENIRWHNKNCEDQLKHAKSVLALKLMSAEGEEADRAWNDFYKDCEKMMERTRKLKELEADYAGDKMTHSSVRDMSRQIEEAKNMRKASLDDQMQSAGERAGTQSSQNKKEGPSL